MTGKMPVLRDWENWAIFPNSARAGFVVKLCVFIRKLFIKPAPTK